MALTRDKKEQVISEIEGLLSDSKLTVIAKYQGTSVTAMQQLRRAATSEGTKLHVVKNRLFKRALAANDKFKNIDTAEFVGQLLYAFNSEDEVAPARSLADFAKTNPQLEFVAAITADGQLLAAAAVKDLASLPTKNVLRAQLVGTIGAPLNGFVNVLAGNIRGVLNVLNGRADALGK
ncbi:MAG TPA: 50S ribosomal protein L10 [Candidatus Saccharimonadales bacterium]|nr:50S ribosomal protein L10 [Candidatus Saccharimonadales bacterium]